jgi:hypothetical protein
MSKRIQHIYETRSAWGGWRIAATFYDPAELARQVDDAKRRGLVEGRDFRTRTERRW